MGGGTRSQLHGGTLSPFIPLSLRVFKGEGERRTEAYACAMHMRMPLVQYWGRMDSGSGAGMTGGVGDGSRAWRTGWGPIECGTIFCRASGDGAGEGVVNGTGCMGGEDGACGFADGIAERLLV